MENQEKDSTKQQSQQQQQQQKSVKLTYDEQVIIKKESYSVNQFYIPEDSKQYIKEIFVSEGEANSRIEQMAYNIYEHFQERKYLCLVLLRGGASLYAKLQAILTNLYNFGKYRNSVQAAYLKCSSYRGNQSTGELKVDNFDLNQVTGQEILLIDDIIDTGLTIHLISDQIVNKYKAKSLKTCTLSIIENHQKYPLPKIDFLGFILPSNYYVGFIYELNDFFRDIKHIVVLTEQAVSKYKNIEYFS